jgi:hypothetical protein
MVTMFYNKRLKGAVKKIAVIDKNSVGLFSVMQKRLTESYFNTSEGFKQVDPILSVISVESSKGYVEIIAGVKMSRSIEIIKELIAQKVAFEDIETVVELIRDNDEINDSVENRLQFLHFLEAKEARREARKEAEKEVATSLHSFNTVASKDIQNVKNEENATIATAKSIVENDNTEDYFNYTEEVTTIITTYRRIKR